MNAAQIEKMKALALAANDLPDVTQPFVSSTGQVVISTFSLKGEQLNTVANFYDATTPAAVLELIAEVDKMRLERAELAAELVSTSATLGVSDVCLVRATNEAAESRAEVERLRAELATRFRAEGGGTSDKCPIDTAYGPASCFDCVERLGSAPAAGTDMEPT